MDVTDLDPRDAAETDRAAALLVDGFRDLWPAAWPDLASAREEVREALRPEKICLGARDGRGALLGWIGGQPSYGGNVWELHPLVVDAAHRGRGIGRRLVEALAERAVARGGITLWLGTDDEARATSVGGIDLYPDPLRHLATLTADPAHPVGFYRRLGFAVAGVLPDANGPGRPDVFLAKRIGPAPAGAAAEDHA